mmetsp:Transcript_6795/g.13610  ORF Transcript_6795/g.13610 Transcript_6795/m.13610 type:complete len:212 (+) Transcript_6795:2094-2729(+)
MLRSSRSVSTLFLLRAPPACPSVSSPPTRLALLSTSILTSRPLTRPTPRTPCTTPSLRVMVALVAPLPLWALVPTRLTLMALPALATSTASLSTPPTLLPMSLMTAVPAPALPAPPSLTTSRISSASPSSLLGASTSAPPVLRRSCLPVSSLWRPRSSSLTTTSRPVTSLTLSQLPTSAVWTVRPAATPSAWLPGASSCALLSTPRVARSS